MRHDYDDRERGHETEAAYARWQRWRHSEELREVLTGEPSHMYDHEPPDDNETEEEADV
jgi:hypothetical protein